VAPLVLTSCAVTAAQLLLRSCFCAAACGSWHWLAALQPLTASAPLQPLTASAPICSATLIRWLQAQGAAPASRLRERTPKQPLAEPSPTSVRVQQPSRLAAQPTAAPRVGGCSRGCCLPGCGRRFRHGCEHSCPCQASRCRQSSQCQQPRICASFRCLWSRCQQ
jgi:hypothetical protein